MTEQSAGAEVQTALSPQEDQACRLYALSALPLQQVADDMGLSVQTVKAYLKRARWKFRQRGIDASSQLRLRDALLADTGA